MESPISTRRGPDVRGPATLRRPTRGPRFPRLRPALVLLVSLTAVVLIPQPALGAARSRSIPRDPQTELARLDARADALAERYRGELVKLRRVEREAKRASARASRLNGKLTEVHARVAQFAALKYKAGPTTPVLRLLVSGDPREVLSRVATTEYLARADARRVRQLRLLTAGARRARAQAETQAAELGRAIDELEGRKDKVERLIARYERQLPSAPGGITPRMTTVYRLVVRKFGAPYGVGCYRDGSSGEHPEGRACDFMLSSAGAMPDSAGVRRGYAIADWAVANAERLGIMYIIYRQRIWDIRSGNGWQPMEDRGSITANHYDHVHISVF
ncbi:MAG: coiled-coil domain-containing protein [Streptosporangiaceae bacterium]